MKTSLDIFKFIFFRSGRKLPDRTANIQQCMLLSALNTLHEGKGKLQKKFFYALSKELIFPHSVTKLLIEKEI
jgi:hypothetical protein